MVADIDRSHYLGLYKIDKRTTAVQTAQQNLNRLIGTYPKKPLVDVRFW